VVYCWNMGIYLSPQGELAKTGNRKQYMERVDFLYEYFDRVVRNDESCWRHLLDLIVKHGYRCPKCGSADLRMSYTAVKAPEKRSHGGGRQQVSCAACKKRLPSITKGEAYKCPDTIFAEQQLSIYDFFWLAFVVTSAEYLEPSRVMDRVLSEDGENPTRYDAVNQWRKRIVGALRIDTSEPLTGDIQVEKIAITAVPFFNVLYCMKDVGRDDGAAYRYMIFPSDVNDKGKAKDDLQRFVQSYCNRGAYRIHSRWKHPEYNFINNVVDPTPQIVLDDFSVYFQKSFLAFEYKVDPEEILLDAAGLYHFSKDNPLVGKLDEDVGPLENNNMLRFNQFILREYNTMLHASRERWKVRL
jgi:DNA-directed RNA polymerase subunit RPC12/RpoP